MIVCVCTQASPLPPSRTYGYGYIGGSHQGYSGAGAASVSAGAGVSSGDDGDLSSGPGSAGAAGSSGAGTGESHHPSLFHLARRALASSRSRRLCCLPTVSWTMCRVGELSAARQQHHRRCSFSSKRCSGRRPRRLTARSWRREHLVVNRHLYVSASICRCITHVMPLRAFSSSLLGDC